MRIALYVRVSTVQQAHNQTIEQQVERLQAHCHQQESAVPEVEIFRDEGYSGATLRRPGLDCLRDQVCNGRFDQILVTEPSRLARKYVHQMLLIEEFEGYGCQVCFVDRPMSQDPNDQLLLQIRGAVAEYERTLIAERMRRGRQHKYRAGLLLPWTRPPYGYRSHPDQPRDPCGGRVEEAEAAIVGEVFALYLQPGQSLCSVSTHLKQHQVPTPTGKTRWTTATLRRILSNPAYTGVVYAGRGRVQPSRRRRSPLAPVGQRGTTSQPTAPEQWILVGHIPALVSQDLFEQVQAKLQTNQQFARRNNRVHNYLLRALGSPWQLPHELCRAHAPHLFVLRLCSENASEPDRQGTGMSQPTHSHASARRGRLGGSLRVADSPRDDS
jgi:site-specific DNA recombinase